MDIDYGKVGERIREIRMNRGITQEKLAELSDLSPQHMNRIEKASRNTSVEAIYRIAAALEVAPDELLYGTENIRKIDYDEELKKLLDDCNDFEMHVLSEMLVNTKRSIRSNLLLLNRKIGRAHV